MVAWGMNRGPGWSGVILISLVLSLAAVFGARIAVQQGILPEATGPAARSEEPLAPTTAEVPALEGMSLSAARELLNARGLTLLVRDKQPHETIPAESVAAQDPLPGSVLKVEAAVSVTLSTGKPNETMVPALAGKSFEDAVLALQTANLRVGAVTGPESGEREVESSEPAAQSLVLPNSAVSLTLVASGIEVPKLVGLRFAKAKQVIDKSGLQLGKVRDRYASYGASLVILEQSPEAGTRAAKGSAIDLIRNAPD